MHDFQEQCQVHGQRSKNMACRFASSTQQEIETEAIIGLLLCYTWTGSYRKIKSEYRLYTYRTLPYTRPVGEPEPHMHG